MFGVLATGFAVLLGLIVVLAFTSYDDSRAGAEDEALAVIQQSETAFLMPPPIRGPLSDQLVCYARHVVGTQWPRAREGAREGRDQPVGGGDVPEPSAAPSRSRVRAVGLRQVARPDV